MLIRANFAWRFCVTGLAFALFGLGGSLMTVLVFLPLCALTTDRECRKLRAQALIQRFFALLVTVLRYAGVMRLELEEAEQLRRCDNVLVFANHPGYLDVVILLSLMPRSSCVVNSRLWRSPFYGGVVRSAGYIRNDSPERLVDDCVTALAEGGPLIVFPEGTRSTPGTAIRMQRGAAHVALRSGRDILPVVLTCDPPALTKSLPWYRIPSRCFTYRVRVLPPLRVKDCVDEDLPASLAARKMTAFLEDFFCRELKCYG